MIDEADSILIDEARIPLVLAGASDDSIPSIVHFAKIVRTLEYGRDFEMDEAGRNVFFTEAGLKKVEKLLKSGNLYAKKNQEVLTRLNCALHAHPYLNGMWIIWFGITELKWWMNSPGA